VKVKWFRYRPGVAQRVGRGIALLFHDRGTRRGWGVNSTPRPHLTHGKDSVPILQEAGWAAGPIWTGGKSRPHRGLILDRPARSQSLYWLSQWARNYNELCNKNKETERRIAPAWNKNTSFSLLPTRYRPTLRYAYTVFLNHVTSPVTGLLRHLCEHHGLRLFYGCYFLQSTWLSQHLYGLLRC